MPTKYIRTKFDRSADLPSVRELALLPRLATKREKYLVLVLGVLALSTFIIAVTISSRAFMVTVPSEGGGFTEGVLGVPRFINPLLATSDADRDLVALVYSGLLRALPNEQFENDLAEGYTTSDDGIVYTFTLKENLKWDDGKQVTADDIVFTVELAQDERIRSPKQANWEGVLVEKVDRRTIRFTRKQAYAPFLENMTLGIMPAHIWKNVQPEEFALRINNIKAIGTGPYKIKKTENSVLGALDMIELTANKNFALGSPLIKSLILKFFPDETKLIVAYKQHQVDSISGISIEGAEALVANGYATERASLSRIFGVFFNQNQSAILADKTVREALLLATPRKELIDFALYGFGSSQISPMFTDKQQVPNQEPSLETRIAEAKQLLDKAGWKVGENGIRLKKNKPLSFTLVTSDSPELSRGAKLLSDTWKELGINVTVKIYEIPDLNTDIIRPRKFDALLFGEVAGHFPDPYAFWHSSGRLDPGLNIAQYTNSIADKALESARQIQDPTKRLEQYAVFENEITRDIPAIFLYAPHYIYIRAEQINNISLVTMSNPSDRFINVYKWYIQTDRIWKIFSPTSGQS